MYAYDRIRTTRPLSGMWGDSRICALCAKDVGVVQRFVPVRGGDVPLVLQIHCSRGAAVRWPAAAPAAGTIDDLVSRRE